uniref:Uncharacterized protein n=1 Tax=Opuntia streptacantha TaxID=393608 RepID=A0A7C8YPD3_OPUST
MSRCRQSPPVIFVWSAPRRRLSGARRAEIRRSRRVFRVTVFGGVGRKLPPLVGRSYPGHSPVNTLGVAAFSSWAPLVTVSTTLALLSLFRSPVPVAGSVFVIHPAQPQPKLDSGP